MQKNPETVWTSSCSGVGTWDAHWHSVSNKKGGYVQPAQLKLNKKYRK
jgi:hypothetical protein